MTAEAETCRRVLEYLVQRQAFSSSSVDDGGRYAGRSRIRRLEYDAAISRLISLGYARPAPCGEYVTPVGRAALARQPVRPDPAPGPREEARLPIDPS